MSNRSVDTVIQGYYCGTSTIVAGATVGTTSDNVEVTGATIDRKGKYSGSVQIAYKATLANGETLKFATAYDESDDGGTTWVHTAVALQAATVASTGLVGATAVSGVHQIPISLAAKENTIRINVTPDLSRAATDTCTQMTTLVLGNSDHNPI